MFFKQLFNRSNKDLRKRIYFTLFCLGIFSIGSAITVPWAKTLYEELGFLEIFNLMSGGGLKSFSIFALGVSPYITAQIITQLLQMDIIPYFKELKDELGYDEPESGSLIRWAKEGVLLLNSLLTVEKDKPLSHKKLGWETFTDEIIKKINEKETPVVFILWGAYARSKKVYITN